MLALVAIRPYGNQYLSIAPPKIKSALTVNMEFVLCFFEINDFEFLLSQLSRISV